MPERIIPFTKQEKDFELELAKDLVLSKFVPNNIFECINPGNVIKSYIPMYLYEGQYQASWSCKISVKKDEDEEDVYEPHSGITQGNFSILNLAYEGNDVPSELLSFCKNFNNYNLNASKEYNPDLIEENVVTMIPNADSDLIWGNNGKRLLCDLAKSQILSQLSKETIKDLKFCTSHDLKHQGRIILVPFWFVYYTYNNEKHYYIMDGTGSKTGMSAPYDKVEADKVAGKEMMIILSGFISFILVVICIIGICTNDSANKLSPLVLITGVLAIVLIVVCCQLKNTINEILQKSFEARRMAAIKNRIPLPKTVTFSKIKNHPKNRSKK